MKAFAGGRTHDQRVRRLTEATGLVRDWYCLNSYAAQRTLLRTWRPISDETEKGERRAESDLTTAGTSKVFFWNRQRSNHAKHRNTSHALLEELCVIASQNGLSPVLVGARCDHRIDCLDLTEIWRKGLVSYQSQLAFYYRAFRSRGVVASVGNLSGAMDGPALLGLPTTFLATKNSSRRMDAWIGSVPDYEKAEIGKAPRRTLTAEGVVDVQTWLKQMSATHGERVSKLPE